MWRVRYGQTKYSNKKTEHNGIYYDSKLEADYAAELDYRKTAGDIRDWERQIPIRVEVDGILIWNYKIDFLIHHLDGTKEYVEVKGFKTQMGMRKFNLFRKQNENKPGVKITLFRGKNERYSWKMFRGKSVGS